MGETVGRELRLALAMRGGVSLAVWIGGACAEIETLRRAKPAGDQGRESGCQVSPQDREAAAAVAAAGCFWRPLLEAAGFDAVRVDVLSGASAGGLNGVLLAASLKWGVEFDRYRDVWLKLGDIKKLLRPPGDPEPKSVLRGDDYFLPQLYEQLSVLVADCPPNDGYLDLTLTATIRDPLAVATVDDVGGDALPEPSHRATFRFRHNAGTTDFHRASDQRSANERLVAKLALAARSTASFPGAFEPATVPVLRPPQVGTRSGSGEGDEKNLFGQFSDASLTKYRVVDGGVLDNIPITLAIDAVAAAPAQGATQRYLLYLDPSPQTTVTGPDRGENMLSTLLSTKSALATAESILDDLEELRRHNDLALRYEALQLGLTAGIDPEQMVDTATTALDGAWRQRSRLTARRIRSLLEDPVPALGEDPFSSREQRWPLCTWPEHDGEAARKAVYSTDELDTLECWLRTCLAQRGPAGLDDDAITPLGPEALVRLSLAVLEVVRDRVEPATAAGGQTQVAQAAKARLYNALWLSMLTAHTLELFWPVYAAACPPPRDTAAFETWVKTALAKAEQTLTWLAAAPAGSAAGAGGAPTEVAALTPLAEEIARRRRRPDGSDRYHGQDLLRAVWSELQECARTCALVMPPADAPAQKKPDCHGPREEHAPLAQLLQGADETTVGRRLLAYEVITQPLQSLSPRPPLPMRFLRVSGAQRSPASDQLFGGRLDAKDKLAGNELANFAAFYKASWRANDWMWGRLDAAAALVNLLLQPSALITHFCPDLGIRQRVKELLERLHKAVTTIGEGSPLCPPPADQASWQAEFNGLWTAHRRGIRRELLKLFAGRTTTLEVTRQTLTLRRQWEILAGEIPCVIETAVGDQLGVGNRALAEAARHESLLTPEIRRQLATRHAAHTPQTLSNVLSTYRVGSETIVDEVGRRDFSELASNLAVATWRAATWRSDGGSRKFTWLLKPVGLLLQALRVITLGVVRLPRWSLVATPLVAVLAAWVAARDITVLGVLDRTTAVAVLAALAIFWALGAMGTARAPRTTAVTVLVGGAALAAGLFSTVRDGVAAQVGARYTTAALGVSPLITDPWRLGVVSVILLALLAVVVWSVRSPSRTKAVLAVIMGLWLLAVLFAAAALLWWADAPTTLRALLERGADAAAVDVDGLSAQQRHTAAVVGTVAGRLVAALLAIPAAAVTLWLLSARPQRLGWGRAVLAIATGVLLLMAALLLPWPLPDWTALLALIVVAVGALWSLARQPTSGDVAQPSDERQRVTGAGRAPASAQTTRNRSG